MAVEWPDLTYYVQPERPASLFEEGATAGWLVLGSTDGEGNVVAGPGQAQPVVVLVDPDGETVFEPTGDWQHVTVTDD